MTTFKDLRVGDRIKVEGVVVEVNSALLRFTSTTGKDPTCLYLEYNWQVELVERPVKKVMKYRVLYQSYDGLYIDITKLDEPYFESKEEFDERYDSLRAIHLIKESAKEFDV